MRLQNILQTSELPINGRRFSPFYLRGHLPSYFIKGVMPMAEAIIYITIVMIIVVTICKKKITALFPSRQLFFNYLGINRLSGNSLYLQYKHLSSICQYLQKHITQNAKYTEPTFTPAPCFVSYSVLH